LELANLATADLSNDEQGTLAVAATPDSEVPRQASERAGRGGGGGERAAMLVSCDLRF
jgi:hypothetical protein